LLRKEKNWGGKGKKKCQRIWGEKDEDLMDAEKNRYRQTLFQKRENVINGGEKKQREKKRRDWGGKKKNETLAHT